MIKFAGKKIIFIYVLGLFFGVIHSSNIAEIDKNKFFKNILYFKVIPIIGLTYCFFKKTSADKKTDKVIMTHKVSKLFLKFCDQANRIYVPVASGLLLISGIVKDQLRMLQLEEQNEKQKKELEEYIKILSSDKERIIELEDLVKRSELRYNLGVKRIEEEFSNDDFRKIKSTHSMD